MTSPSPTPQYAAELALEQAHVDRVYRQLEIARTSAQKLAKEGQSLYQTERADFVREEDSTGMLERDVFVYQAARRLATLEAEHDGLVFGKLDHTDGEVRYIGRIGVRDEEYDPLVIDWRAPAAEPFYRATPAAPMEVVRRRVLRCRGDQVVGIEDDLLAADHANGDLVVLGEGALMAALSRARGHTMRDIVATIQGEQDEAIRAPHQGVTVIGGGPGTGKTVVALHRAAYLLYSHRKRFERGGVLVVGPSSVFMNYIERVLPSLGEESVTLRPIGGVAHDVLGLRSEEVDTPAAAAVKGSLRMATLMRRLVDAPSIGSAHLDLHVSIEGEVLRLRSEDLRAVRRRVLSETRANLARDRAESALLEELWQRKPDSVDVSREVFADRVSSQASYRMLVNAWWPTLDPIEQLHRLSDPALLAEVAEGLLSPAEQETLAQALTPEQPLTVADVALLDELVELIGLPQPEPDAEESLFLPDGTEVNEVVTTSDRLRHTVEVDPNDDPFDTFAHVLIDEAQDITPMQWRMLRRRGPQASWTIVGDPAQSTWPDPAETERALQHLIGHGPSRRFRMSTNYRSPAEVYDFAAAVVQRDYPEVDVPEAVRRTGREPELLVTPEADLPAHVTATISALADDVEGTIGIICPPSRLASLQAETGRADLPQDRLAVVTAIQAKGLEYDAAVVVDPSGIVAQSSGGTRVLYVALTRPTQRLVAIDVDAPGDWRPSTAD
ncbi:HelD family protein [Parenemella sanctibonifatiensis]|uniref:Helicase n=1 Tax=Parenemella sanctibonifatiensis TaxID=2016505 RepID=A0A255E9U6_9ACTN|nr:UvrD-helicase domain-containing protein [Parenemella sanctibonifatiensis]OYN88347.1 helicase [Parenemella sanctibonifatiensis]